MKRLTLLFIIILTAFIIWHIKIKDNNTNLQKVDKYISQTVNNNFIIKSGNDIKSDYLSLNEYRKWNYENGYLMFALYKTGKYDEIVNDFYDKNILDNGHINEITMPNNYKKNELDSFRSALLLKDIEKKQKYINAAENLFNDLKKQPTLSKCGNNYMHKAYNKHWSEYPFALDGLYMVLPFYLRYTNDYKSVFYKMNWVAKNLKLENGLYAHGSNCTKNNGIVWLRASGWYAMAQVDIIEKFPESSEKQIMIKQLNSFFDSMLNFQDKKSGMWHNIIYPETKLKCNILESSGTLMLSYALLKAYNLGFINDKKYKDAGLRAFNGTINRCLHKNIFGNYYLDDILFSSKVENTPQQYCECNKYVKDEAKGIASLILAYEQVKLIKN